MFQISIRIRYFVYQFLDPSDPDKVLFVISKIENPNLTGLDIEQEVKIKRNKGDYVLN